MDLTLIRDTFTDKSTLGEIFIDGGHQCFTLELPDRDGLPGSAIPQGTYKIELAPSPRFMVSEDAWMKQFSSRMPHITGIPGRSLIMIHWGNFPNETDGCILVGETRGADSLGNSREAFQTLYARLSDGDTLMILGGAKQQPVLGVDEATQI